MSTASRGVGLLMSIVLCADACAAVGDIEIAQDAPYLRDDGSVYIVADTVMAPLLEALNARFVRDHPGVRITLFSKSPPTGIDGIVAGVSAFAAVAHDAWEGEVEPLRRQTGRRPGDLHIGRRGYRGEGRETPPGVYVNAANPLAGLTLADVARVFTIGQTGGDLRSWGQVGVTPFPSHAIHVYGTRNDGAFLTSIVDTHFAGHKPTMRYEGLASDREVVDAVANDRYGIGLAGFVDADSLPASVRLLPLSKAPGAPASTATWDEVASGAYPLSPFLHFYFRTGADGRPDAFVAAYARLALSDEGQRLLAELGRGIEGYVPLTPVEVEAELRQLR